MSLGNTRPVKAGSIKEGNHILHNDEVYKVITRDKSKAGKHGHAKIRMKIEHITTGSKKSLVMPGDDKVRQPLIDKRIGQVISVSPDSVQIMDLEDYDTFEVAKPDPEEIGGELSSSDEVDYWKVMGEKIIRRKRSSD